VPVCFNQEANGLVVSQVDYCATLSAACSAPPQVDISTCNNSSSKMGEGTGWVRTFLACLRSSTAFAPGPVQPVLVYTQGNEGNANAGKNKPDKSKSKPDKQGGREQQDRKKPKTKG
jgi:hypothetical protein